MRSISTALAASIIIAWATAATVAPEAPATPETPATPEAPVAPEAPVTLTFTGDLLLDRGVRRVIEAHGGSPDCLFTPAIDSLFAGSQAVVANLECPATEVVAPVFKRFIFRAQPEWLTALRRHGITHLNLANNHSIDQGRKGLMDTRLNTVRAGMTPVGADSTMAAAARPVLLYPADSSAAPSCRKVWLIASLRMTLENFAYLEDCPGVSNEPMDSLLQRVARLRGDDSTAVIIVSLHWGAEHRLEPVPAQRLDAHRLIDAGADVLICHHTHTLQTTETYRGRKIYYSIGNFIFDQQKPLNSRACLVSVSVTPHSVTTKALPITISHCVPTIDTRTQHLSP